MCFDLMNAIKYCEYIWANIGSQNVTNGHQNQLTQLSTFNTGLSFMVHSLIQLKVIIVQAKSGDMNLFKYLVYSLNGWFFNNDHSGFDRLQTTLDVIWGLVGTWHKDQP